MNASSTPPRREGVRFARLIPLLLGLGCLAACIAVIVLALLPTPDFSPPVDVDEEFEQRARSFEQSFASEFTRVRPSSDPWGIRIRESDLNAWFWTRFPDWIAHLEGSDAVGADPFLQVELSDDRIRLVTQSVAFAFNPVIDARATVVQSAPGSSFGRLPVPSTLFDWAAAAIDLEQLSTTILGKHFSDQRSGEQVPVNPDAPDGIRLPAHFPLGDGRTVELLEVQMGEGQLVLVFQTM